MVAKVRPLYPDVWSDEDLVECSPHARLLFMGMWNHACDNGHLPDKSKQLKLRILPADDVNVAELLRELADAGVIERSDGWLTIPGAAKRWRVDMRYFKGCDKPGCQKPERETRRGPTGTTREPAEDPEGTPCAPTADGDGEVMVITAAAAVRARTPLPPRVEILKSKLDARKLVVRWDRLGGDDLAEIERLAEVHGDGPLVTAALQAFRPDSPAAFAQAWLPAWRSLPEPGQLRAVDPPCPEPGHSGTTGHCAQCASEAKAAAR